MAGNYTSDFAGLRFFCIRQPRRLEIPPPRQKGHLRAGPIPPEQCFIKIRAGPWSDPWQLMKRNCEQIMKCQTRHYCVQAISA